MQPSYAARYHELEERHWWFVARREIVLALLQRRGMEPGASILEIGCSGGSLLMALRQAGFVHALGIDISETAITLARSRGVKNVEVMDGAALAFTDETFDVVIASDVLEHIQDETGALLSWRRVLRPGGQLIVFVPAFMALWSGLDVVAEHFRRYTARGLSDALLQTGFLIERVAHWNVALLAPVATVRLLMRLLPRRADGGVGAHQLAPVHPLAQRLLLGLLRVENRQVAAGVNFPAGISVFAIARTSRSPGTGPQGHRVRGGAHPRHQIGSAVADRSGASTALSRQSTDSRGIPPLQCFHELFEAQAVRTPDTIAVECGPRHLTYCDLNTRANQIAHDLLEVGVGPETRVGVYMERSIDMLAGLLGIMKAGGAYVPLDPDLPMSRIEFMLRDSGPAVVVTTEGLPRTLPDHGARVVGVGGDEPRVSEQLRENPRSPVRAINLAYVLYTSGSTGTPKGVEVSHGALVNLLESMRHEPGLSADDVLLSVTRLSFDIAALELYLPLMVGGRLVIASRETSTDGRRLVEAIETSGATVMQATPATWHLLLQAGWKGNARLKVLCGGEPLSANLSAALRARVDSLWNVYGPTETTIWSTVWKAGPGPTSIGRPIANTQVHILDGSLEPVPPGMPGELYIGGEGVARGYLGRPELTAGKFIPDPFGEPGTRLFRTGDLAAYRPDGNIQFLGRIDNQVKIHGYRIELGEIEAVLARDPAVQQVIVIAREDIPGDKRLVAYLVLSSGQVVTTDKLRLALMRELPAYMVPSAFVFLERLPLTPSGKIDRRALPPPDQSRLDPRRHFVAPRDRLERQLVKIWEKLLGKQGVGILDDFFELGGHSLLGARLFVEIERSLGKFLPVATLFQAPTVKQLAQLIRQDGDLPFRTSVVELQRSGSKTPFFWVHGDGSNVLLGRHLGPDQPLYGFLHQAADGELAKHVTVEDIATHYLEELRSVQSEGPYVLGGYSFGAMVAFEMAQRLQRAGQKVALLFLLYPGAPVDGGRSLDQRRRFRSRAGSVSQEVRRNLREFAQLGPRNKLARVMPGVKARVRRRIQTQAINVCVGLRLRLPPSVRSPYILDIYFRALQRYVPRPYRNAALVFVEKAGEERYWRHLLTGNVEIHHLAAGHGEVITLAYLEVWAKALRDWLQRIGGDTTAQATPT